MITAQKYYYNGNILLFSCSDGKVRDDEYCEWVGEWFRGNKYFRKTGTTTRVALSTLKKSQNHAT